MLNNFIIYFNFRSLNFIIYCQFNYVFFFSWLFSDQKNETHFYKNSAKHLAEVIYSFLSWSKARVIYYANNWIYTTNHKRIAVNYFWFVILSGIFGMVLATVIRLELAYPGVGIFAGDSLQYLSLATAHGVIMVFFMIIPLISGAFANFLLPTQLGVHDVAFPRLNSAAFWFLPGGLVMLGQLICLDRRYQRMNCFNIREAQALLKRKFFMDLINSNDHHTILSKTILGLRFKTNDLLTLDTNMEIHNNYAISLLPKSHLNFFNEQVIKLSAIKLAEKDKTFFNKILDFFIKVYFFIINYFAKLFVFSKIRSANIYDYLIVFVNINSIFIYLTSFNQISFSHILNYVYTINYFLPFKIIIRTIYYIIYFIFSNIWYYLTALINKISVPFYNHEFIQLQFIWLNLFWYPFISFLIKLIDNFFYYTILDYNLYYYFKLISINAFYILVEIFSKYQYLFSYKFIIESYKKLLIQFFNFNTIFKVFQSKLNNFFNFHSSINFVVSSIIYDSIIILINLYWAIIIASIQTITFIWFYVCFHSFEINKLFLFEKASSHIMTIWYLPTIIINNNLTFLFNNSFSLFIIDLYNNSIFILLKTALNSVISIYLDQEEKIVIFILSLTSKVTLENIGNLIIKFYVWIEPFVVNCFVNLLNFINNVVILLKALDQYLWSLNFQSQFSYLQGFIIPVFEYFFKKTENTESGKQFRGIRFYTTIFSYDYKVGNYFSKIYLDTFFYLTPTIAGITGGVRVPSWFLSATACEAFEKNNSFFFANFRKFSNKLKFFSYDRLSSYISLTEGFYNFFTIFLNNKQTYDTYWTTFNLLHQKFELMFNSSSMQQRLYTNWRQLKFTREAWRCKLLIARHQKSLFRRYLHENGLFWSIERNAKDLLPGWAMITPFSSRPRFTAIGKVDIGVSAILLVLISSIISAVNFLVTYKYLSTLNNRKMRDARSFFTEGIMCSSWMMIAANPMLVIGLIMLLSDRHWQTSFFDYSGGGDTILFQHMFWFFGHPEVYIVIIPTFGFVNTLFSYYLRKRISARASLLYSIYTIAFLGFFVWGHHMYMVGLSHTTRMLFSTLTVMISVPAATKLMHWCVTLVNSAFVVELPFLFMLTYVFLFVSGGISGMCVAHTGMDILFHDTFYVIGHFHVMFAGAAMFGAFGAFYFYFSAIFGVKYSRIYAYLHFTYYLLGQLLTVIPMFWLGYAGMPRRVLDYPSAFGGWHSIITAGHLLSVAGLIAFFIMLFDSLRQSRAATRTTLGIIRYNTRLNFYLYETARISFIQQKGWYLYRYFRPTSFKLNGYYYTNYEYLETTLYSYTFNKLN